ncbi:YqcC family protein [Neiella marina]|uniref:YqcC family protein n=1 Tax=Neiella holothuriorum TaxID=2870530 RepID=A0ABS7EHD3_9GAMM|nr:YqcC family protein [Neiella holothuriorum]MBW8191749.1 YqcC family protein [Neiella holothuriorum]
MTFGTRHQQMAQLLVKLTQELQLLSLWQREPPSPQALASREPFCVDTLTLPQWLQFIFIPKMGALIQAEQPLPVTIGIAPLAEQTYQHELAAKQTLIELLRAIDDC